MIKLLQAFGICKTAFTFCHSMNERNLFTFAQQNKKRRHENYFDLEFQIST